MWDLESPAGDVASLQKMEIWVADPFGWRDAVGGQRRRRPRGRGWLGRAVAWAALAATAACYVVGAEQVLSAGEAVAPAATRHIRHATVAVARRLASALDDFPTARAPAPPAPRGAALLDAEEAPEAAPVARPPIEDVAHPRPAGAEDWRDAEAAAARVREAAAREAEAEGYRREAEKRAAAHAAAAPAALGGDAPFPAGHDHFKITMRNGAAAGELAIRTTSGRRAREEVLRLAPGEELVHVATFADTYAISHTGSAQRDGAAFSLASETYAEALPGGGRTPALAFRNGMDEDAFLWDALGRSAALAPGRGSGRAIRDGEVISIRSAASAPVVDLTVAWATDAEAAEAARADDAYAAAQAAAAAAAGAVEAEAAAADAAERHAVPAPAFRAGDAVEARFGAGEAWYPGAILEGHGAAFDVAYDDGDVEYGVPAALIRRYYKAGESVEVRFKGGDRWYPAEIAARAGRDTYDVAYDDGDAEAAVHVDKIRPPA